MAKLCDPQTLSVLIPYKDLEKLMSFAKDYEAMTADYANLKQRVAALHGLYSEVLETVTRIYDEL